MPKQPSVAEAVRVYGVHTVDTTDLIASIVGARVPREKVVALMDEFGSLSGLMKAPVCELAERIGKTAATNLKMALEIGRRASIASPAEPRIITRAEDAFGILTPLMRHAEQEEFWVIICNNRNHVLRTLRLYTGTVDGINIRPAEVFRDAIRINGCSIIVAHNHPSGDPCPSLADIEMTNQLVKAGQMLGIKVLDHVIVGHTCVSLAQRGLGFE